LAGDPLARLAMVVEFELFRPELEAALARSDRARGGRPPYDAVLMFKVLVLQTLYTLSDDQTEYQIRDRLSFMRFWGSRSRTGCRTPRPSGCSASS
jgi:transposase, IS5 family